MKLSADSKRRFAIALAGLALAVLSSPALVKGEYFTIVLAVVTFNAIAVASLTVLAGASGIWSLSHPAFIAIGAYLTANLAALGVPIEACLLIALVLGGALGFVLGLSAGRFSTLYFGLLTLAVSLTGTEIIGRWSAVTGGDIGMQVPPVKSWLFGMPLTDAHGASLSIVIATCVFLVLDWVVKGARGRRWRAIKSQRTAAMSIGLVPHRENALAFALSAALATSAGVAGAVAIGYLDAGEFNLDRGVMLIVGTVVGGIGSLPGALLGAGFLALVPELARGLRDIAAFAFGASLIATLMFLPRGIVPSVRDGLMRLRRSRRQPAAAQAAPVRPPSTAAASMAQITALARTLMPRADATLTVERLSVTFGGLKALQEVSLTVAPGQTVGLIGPNGAGKTTLLNALSGYVKAVPGSVIRLGTHELTTLAPHARLKCGYGRTFQHAELFEELTVREILLLAAASRPGSTRGHSADEIADLILDGLALRDVAGSYPKALPFGIQKVADIGRLLAAGPQLVALDEPFSGLDADEARHLQAILAGMKAGGVSILIIDHAVAEVLAIADHVVVLDFGKVLATGRPEDVRRDPRVLSAYFGRAGDKLFDKVIHEQRKSA
ncbi:ATP-binding cassette domain-containing protein [Variovorax humicola]|uniref:ATP-binding cassette domain-containing protein n=1 Tax=Variovorax humicola TaxID=1769758 RepID=A0ABU8W946_9BURK